MDRNAVEARWLETSRVAPDDWSRLSRLLSEEERARAARFRFDRDRHSYIAGHALTRALLSEAAPEVAPESWRFIAMEHGRPEVAPDAGQPRLRFNLSHTHGLAAVAVTAEGEIGLDVESLDRSNLTLELAERFFAPEEVAMLTRLPEERLTEGLYAIWTLKESFIKAVGLGLSLPLDSFAFTLAPLAIRFTARIAPFRPADDPARWRFQRMRPTDHHALALALRPVDGAAPNVEARPADLSTLLRLADAAAD